MVGSNLKDQQLQQIVDKTIMEADLDRDGKISFEEFTKMVENTDVSMSMTLGECLIFLFFSFAVAVAFASELEWWCWKMRRWCCIMGSFVAFEIIRD